MFFFLPNCFYTFQKHCIVTLYVATEMIQIVAIAALNNHLRNVTTLSAVWGYGSYRDTTGDNNLK